MAEVQKERKEKLRFTCVSKKGIEKMVMPAAVCEPEGEAVLREEMAQIVADGGKLYLFCVKKEPVGYLLFEKTKIELPKEETEQPKPDTGEGTTAKSETEPNAEEQPNPNTGEGNAAKSEIEPNAETGLNPHTGEENAAKGKTKPDAQEPREVWAYRLLRRSLPEEYEESVQTLEKGILEDLKERAEWNDCKAIVWGENLYRHDEEKWGIFTGSGLVMGVALGVIYGMLFDNMALGICIGISLGSCFGAVWTMVGKKK